MEVEMKVVGSTDKTVRCEMWLAGVLAGELQVGRDEFTKLCGLLFLGNYKVIANLNPQNA